MEIPNAHNNRWLTLDANLISEIIAREIVGWFVTARYTFAVQGITLEIFVFWWLGSSLVLLLSTGKETDGSWDICIYNTKYQFWAGVDSQAVLWKKNLRPIMSKFWGLLFYVFMVKKKFCQVFFTGEIPGFIWAKNFNVSTKGKSNYRGYDQNPAIQNFIFIFSLIILMQTSVCILKVVLN